MPSPILADKAFLGATITNFFFFSLDCFILAPLHLAGRAAPTAFSIRPWRRW